MGYEKDIFGSLHMNSNSRINHGESRVYHQLRRNCISSKRSFVYHHCEKKCSLRLMIYTFGDEMHACAWWYTIAFAMDKKDYGKRIIFHSLFGAGKRIWTSTFFRKLEPESNASANSAMSAQITAVFSRRSCPRRAQKSNVRKNARMT